MLTPQWLDELRARVTLSSVIGRTTRLTKAGHEFKACCPFHNEKSPSFTVNDQKGFYHCFGCGAHGDVIRWMTDQRGLSFMDAVKELASEAGMEVPAPDPRAAKAAEQRDTLHDVMKAAQDWFVAQLAGPEGERARAYLATRGFDAHTVQRFGFGYAPEGRQALKAALKDVPEDRLIEAGLRIAVEDKEPYDRFRGRLMLPIEDARGRVIAFGGRILDAQKTDAPKYLNSPDTPLFDKGRTLYNLHRAGPASAPDRADRGGRRLYGRDRAGGGGDRGCRRPARHGTDRTATGTAVAAGRNADPLFRWRCRRAARGDAGHRSRSADAAPGAQLADRAPARRARPR